MANHGAVTTGPDLRTALTRARALEWVCDVYLRAAAAGQPRLLPAHEIERVVAKMSSYGQRAPRADAGRGPRDGWCAEGFWGGRFRGAGARRGERGGVR